MRRLAVTGAVADAFADRDMDDRREVARWLSALTEGEQRQAVSLLNRLLKELLT